MESFPVVGGFIDFIAGSFREREIYCSMSLDVEDREERTLVPKAGTTQAPPVNAYHI